MAERIQRRESVAAFACSAQLTIQRLRVAGSLAGGEALRVLVQPLHQPVVPVGVLDGEEVRTDQGVESRVVFHDGEGAGVGEHVAGDARPVDDPSGVAGELVEEDVLAARVHVAGRVDRGCFAPRPGEPVGERVGVEVAQVVAGGEVPEDALSLADDELRTAVDDAGAARVRVGVSDLARPLVQITGQVPMDRQ